MHWIGGGGGHFIKYNVHIISLSLSLSLSLPLSLSPSLPLSLLQLIAVASWDSTVHDTSSLNKVTGANDRVFAIVRVGVKLKNPPGVEIMLRKRICLRVYKRIGIGAAIMKAFSRVRE